MITLRLLTVLCSFAAAASASGYCSLIVEVRTPDGKRPTANVTVTEQNGRELYQLAEGQDARFCGLGLRPVTVKVGGDRTCNQVVINDVPLYWQKTHYLKVLYDIMPCLVESTHVFRFCTYLFRISDDAGKWISGASVQVAPGDRLLRSDDYGRARVDAEIGAIIAAISAPGYTARSFDSTCTPEKAVEQHEEPIRLTRK
jgi:hypothetical protein